MPSVSVTCSGLLKASVNKDSRNEIDQNDVKLEAMSAVSVLFYDVLNCWHYLYRYILVYRGTQSSQKSSEQPENSLCQQGDIKQVAYLEPTNISRHRRKFSCPSDTAPGICAPLHVFVCIMSSVLDKGMSVSVGGTILSRGKPTYWERYLSQCHSFQHKCNRLAWDRTWAYEVRSQRLPPKPWRGHGGCVLWCDPLLLG